MKVNHGKIVYILFLLMILFLIIPVSFASNETVNLEDNEVKIEGTPPMELNSEIDNNNVEKIQINDEEQNCELNNNLSYTNALGSNSGSIISSDFEMYYKNGSKFVATFLDSNNKPLLNFNINVKINGITYTKTTDSNGKLYFSINLNPGVYDITLTNLNDGFSKINKVTVLSTIQGNNLVKYYKNESQFYATILNGTGHYATHTPIEINIHGVIYTKVTDSTGKAKMNINLNPGIYILTVKNTLDGLQMSYTVEVLSTIIGSTFTKFKSEAKAFTVTILNGVGNL